jgi:CRP-like cAMP-binding protein
MDKVLGNLPLFIDESYPSTAVAFQDSKIVKLSKDKFLKILDEYSSIQKDFLNLMALRIHSINLKPLKILSIKNLNLELSLF